jgi:enamine deaminase RidA (YjgF/YER057c/UK114 family)
MAAQVRYLNPKTLAPPPGYTSVVEATGPSRTIYIAGQLGLDLDNKVVGEPGDFRAQCVKAFENLGLALAAVGADFTDIVKITNYLTDMADLKTYIEIRNSVFTDGPPPASTLVAISRLARPGAVFEIDAIAVLPAKVSKAPAKSAAKRAPLRKRAKSKKGRRR